MPKFKKALEINKLSKKLKEDLENSPSYFKDLIGKGVAGGKTTEPIPQLQEAAAEMELKKQEFVAEAQLKASKLAAGTTTNTEIPNVG